MNFMEKKFIRISYMLYITVLVDVCSINVICLCNLSIAICIILLTFTEKVPHLKSEKSEN